jgi:hypothetical protein
VSDEPERRPDKRWFMDRPSARTPDEREQHYLDWLGKNELEDIPERRDTWFRRYRWSTPRGETA